MMAKQPLSPDEFIKAVQARGAAGVRVGAQSVEPPAVDPVKYGRLCAKYLPMVIVGDPQFDHMQVAVGELMDKTHLTIEESAILDLLVKLVKDYDNEHYPLPASYGGPELTANGE
jgi:hypothetical protein